MNFFTKTYYYMYYVYLKNFSSHKNKLLIDLLENEYDYSLLINENNDN